MDKEKKSKSQELHSQETSQSPFPFSDQKQCCGVALTEVGFSYTGRQKRYHNHKSV